MESVPQISVYLFVALKWIHCCFAKGPEKHAKM